MTAFTIPNEADAAFPDQAELDNRDLADMIAAALAKNGVISGCAVTAQGTPDMTVAVASGTAYIGGEGVPVGAGNVTIGAANATNPRFDLICIDATGAKSAVAGTASSNPVFPDPAGKVVLAAVYVPANDTAINANQIVDKRVMLKLSTPGLYDATEYGAVADDYFTDGSCTAASTTFTSATASFTSADVGKVIVILRGGASQMQKRTTTISSVTNSTTVVLANSTGVTNNPVRFYISRAGDQTAAIHAAEDAAKTNGGGRVTLPGVGYLTTGLTLRDRVSLDGAGHHGTFLHLAPGSNTHVIQNDTTSNLNAMNLTVSNLWIDGARDRQSTVTTTLGAAYTAGDTTLTVASNTNLNPSGFVKIGSVWLRYLAKSGSTTLTGVKGGIQNTTDANQANGATVTQFKSSCLYFATNPYSSQHPAPEDNFDPHFFVRGLYIGNCIGSGIESWGQSESHWDFIYAEYCDNFAYAPTYDSFLDHCDAGQCARAGFYLWSTNLMLSVCKAWFCGNVTAADGHGFLLESPSQPAIGMQQLVACIAQDNYANGYFLKNTDRADLQSCGADSNGQGGADGTYVGIKLLGANYNIIDIVCTERKSDGTTQPQQNALEIDATSNFNQIRLTHGAASTATVGPAIKPGSDLSGGNNIVINSMGGTKSFTPITGTITVTTASPAVFTKVAHGLIAGDAFQLTTTGALPTGLAVATTYYVISTGLTADTFRASTTLNGSAVNTTGTQSGTHSIQGMISPDPYMATTYRVTTLPHNIRVENPQNAHLGCPIRFLFTQDATGGRTITWGSSFQVGIWLPNPAPSSTSPISFVYDGTNWVSTEDSKLYWTVLSKRADTTRTASAALTADPDLQFSMLANTKYRITLIAFFDTTAAGDFQYDFSGPASPTLVRMERVDGAAGVAPAERIPDVAMPAATALAGTGTTGGYIKCDIIFHNGANAGPFAFRWAQNASDAGNTIVRAGSRMEFGLA